MFAHILNALHFEPWLITDSGHATILALLDSKLAGESLAGPAHPGKSLFGEALPVMRVADGIAEIPIVGTIGKGLGNLEKSCGATSVEDIQKNIAEAISRPDVRGILLDINSPGGSVAGIPETSDLIQAAVKKKPIVAFTDGTMASAAYWLGAQANAVIASKSASVGSIGVYVPWRDSSRAADAMGVKVGVVKNTGGTFKGMGFPGTSMTEEQMAYLQDRVDELFGMFKTAVVSTRKRVSADAMRGQTYFGRSAQAVGLIDAVGSHADAWRELDSMSRTKPV